MTAIDLPRARLENARGFHPDAHPESGCAGRQCATHNRSAHNMRSWPQNFREDIGIMGRISPIGGWHPDPDDMARSPEGVHDCMPMPLTGNGVCGEWLWHGSRAAFLYHLAGTVVTQSGRVFELPRNIREQVVWDDPLMEVEYVRPPRGHVRAVLANYATPVPVRELVWRAWRGERTEGVRIGHADGDRSNNSLRNLIAVQH